MKFLNTTGFQTLTIGICDRCRVKMSITKLHRDPNYPGLRVCAADLDEKDPWTLPARQPENLTPHFVRPDTPVEWLGPVSEEIPTIYDSEDLAATLGEWD